MSQSTKPINQREKFIDAARKSSASEDEDVFDRALKKVAKAPPPETVKERKARREK